MGRFATRKACAASLAKAGHTGQHLLVMPAAVTIPLQPGTTLQRRGHSHRAARQTRAGAMDKV